MQKYYIIQNMAYTTMIAYLKPMLEGSTHEIDKAGTWESEEAAFNWIKDMNGKYCIIPIYIK